MSESAYFSHIRPDNLANLAAAAQSQPAKSHVEKVTAGDQNALRILSDKINQLGPDTGMLEFADASLRKGQSVEAMVAYAWLMSREDKKGLTYLRLKSKFESAAATATRQIKKLIGKSTENFRTAMNKELRQTWCSPRVQRLFAYREAFNQLESDWFKTRDMVTNFFA